MDIRPENSNQAADGAGDRLDVLRTWRIITKHKWVVIGTAVSVFTMVMAWNLRKPRIYQSAASVIIDPHAPKVLGQINEVVQLGSGQSGMWASADYYNTQQRILRSWSLAEKVVRRYELFRDHRLVGLPQTGKVTGKPPTEDDLIKRATGVLQGKIQVLPVKDSRVFQIAVKDRDAQFATDLANRVAEVYTEENINLKRETTRTATRWVHEQLDEAQKEVRQKEQMLYEFRKENNILSVALEDSQNMITKALQEFSTGLTDTQKARIDLDSRMRSVKLLIDSDALDTPTAAKGNVALDSARNNYLEAHRKAKQIEERYGPKHPEYINSKIAVDAADADLKRVAQTVLRAMDSEAAALKEAEESYQKQVARLKSDALNLNQKEVDYKRLVRDAENAATIYTNLLKRHNESNLQEQDLANNIRILDRAMLPTAPIEPNMKNVTVIAIALALFLGFGLAVFIDILDRTVKTQEDVETLVGVPVLGFVPSVDEGAPTDGAVRELYITKHPTSTAAESCRVIRTNITFCSPDRPLRALVVTSSNPAEGKTMNVVNLGVVMAQGGHRTLLVDSDMRRPRLHKVLKVGNEKGLSSAIVGDCKIEDAVKSTDLPNLFVLPCGPLPPNPAELLQTDKFSALVQRLTERFDRVIFDSPPLLAVTDAAIISRVVDGTVLVVRAGRTTRDSLFRAKRHVDAVNARVVGVVINDVDLKNAQYAGYYYYYNYYHERPAAAAQGADKA